MTVNHSFQVFVVVVTVVTVFVERTGITSSHTIWYYDKHNEEGHE